jgi:hypothetical protein
MKYALLIYPGPSPDEGEQISEDEEASIEAEYVALASAPGVLAAHRLHPPASTTTVRVQDGRTLMTDGPFANTKEVVGGFCLFEAENLDAALAHAARLPAARMGGAIEVRPLVEH